jgi:hypothetical protein
MNMTGKKFTKARVAELTKETYVTRTLEDGTEVCLKLLKVTEVRDMFMGLGDKGNKKRTDEEKQAEAVKRSDKLLSVSIVDPDDKTPVLTEEDVRAMPATDVAELVKIVLNVNGLAKDKEDEGN